MRKKFILGVLVSVLLIPFSIKALDLGEAPLSFSCEKGTIAPNEEVTCTLSANLGDYTALGFETEITLTDNLVFVNFTKPENTSFDAGGSASQLDTNTYKIAMNDSDAEGTSGMFVIGYLVVRPSSSATDTATISFQNALFSVATSNASERVDVTLDPKNLTISSNSNNNNTNNQTNNQTNTTTVSKTEHVYSLDDNSYVMSFMEDSNKEFSLTVQSLLKVKEGLEKGQVPKEQLEATNKIMEEVTDALKSKGTFIDLYTITVSDNATLERKTQGTFTFKIKKTDVMGNYDSYVLVYLDDNKKPTDTVVKLKVDGDYLVGELPHLSQYALVGKKNIDNPGTGVTISILGIGALLAGAISYSALRKKNYFNKI